MPWGCAIYPGWPNALKQAVNMMPHLCRSSDTGNTTIETMTISSGCHDIYGSMSVIDAATQLRPHSDSIGRQKQEHSGQRIFLQLAVQSAFADPEILGHLAAVAGVTTEQFLDVLRLNIVERFAPVTVPARFPLLDGG